MASKKARDARDSATEPSIQLSCEDYLDWVHDRVTRRLFYKLSAIVSI